MRMGNLNLNRAVLQAPLAGISSRPFRVLAIRSGAAVTYTEMVSSEGVVRRQSKTMELMQFQSDEQPIGIQLFGANPEVIGQAARITAREYKPDIIDINFGCPVKKVVNKNGGAAVLKDLVLTEDIMKAAVEGAGDIPVTIKIRTGWEEKNPVYLRVGELAEKCGVKAITLHARSRAGGFSGLADWSAIAKLKEAVNIAVIGNGDVFTPIDAKRMFDETGCDAVMVGRAALGNPFIFRQMNVYLKSGNLEAEPTLVEKLETAKLHARLVAEQYGEERGVVKMRKHLGWYVKGLPGAGQLRPKLFQVSRLDDIDVIFTEYLAKQA
ncbi:MAG: tRNA dihydrouridine synthase DusB [Candidatus Zixiibacteriota bacterium]